MAQGIFKTVIAKKETSWGTKAAASGAQLYRRVTGSFQLEKDGYESGEINTSQQVKDFRHGSRRASGSLNGEISGGAYTDFIQAALRRDFTAGVTTGAVIVIAADETAGVSKFIRSTGSFVTDGFKKGDVISVTGFTNAGNNGIFVVVAVSALELTIEHFDEGGVLVTEAEGDSVTIVAKGKNTYVPLTAHTDDSFTVEEFYDDDNISRTFLGMIVDTMGINIAPNSMATIDFGFMGKDAEAPTTSQYFTSPTAQPSEGIYSGPDGLLILNGVASRKVTSLRLNIANGTSMEAVIGSVAQGAKSRGKVSVTGSLSAIFDSSAIFDYFDDETEISLTYALRSADNTEAFALHMDRVKVNSGSTDDGEKTVILSADFQALEYLGVADGALNTTLRVQDTTLV
jgi:hypothetical protein